MEYNSLWRIWASDLLRQVRALCWTRTVLFQKSKYSATSSYPRFAAFSGLAPFWIWDFIFLTVDLMLCWHFFKEALQEEEVLAKAAVKLRVEIFCLAWCSSSLRTGKGTLATGAPGGLGVIQILAKSVFNSWILSWKVGCPTLYHLEVDGGGLTYFPSDKLAALKSRWNLSKASLITELSGRIEERPLGLSSWRPFSSSRPNTEVEDLGIESLGSGRERMRLKVSTSSEYWEGMSDRATSL